MLHKYGKSCGERHGGEDATQGKVRHPRPTLSFSLASPNYLSAYLTAYHTSFDLQERLKNEMAFRDQIDAARLRQTKGNSSRSGKPVDPIFEKGWQDGYEGRSAGSKQLENDGSADQKQISAYMRGFRIGQRDREYARAKELRQKKTHDQVRGNHQGDLER